MCELPLLVCIFMNLEYLNLILIENLFQAWNEFKRGKKNRADVQLFERNLEDNLFSLHFTLENKTYKHGDYFSFYVNDPKRRHIHKAKVADRIIHHLLYQYLYNLWDKTFIYDSYSCRLGKGTHKAVKRLELFTGKVSKNYVKPCWTLKFDIKKFFASVDHKILLRLLKLKINDDDILRLIKEVINSFCICHSRESGNLINRQYLWIPHQVRDDNGCKGIPLGNLTSQVFANIYMDELDKFVKHKLKVKYYIRYADDFLLLSDNKKSLKRFINPISEFLQNHLKLELHPNKIILRRLDWGIDFLGYVVLPHYILPRTKTKRRIFKKLKMKINDDNFNQSFQSYLGYLSHANSYKLIQELKNQVYFWVEDFKEGKYL